MNTARFFMRLKLQNLSKLEKQAGVSRQALHNAIKTKNMRLDNLQSVAKALNYAVELIPHVTEDNVLASLVDWGAPLAYSKGGNLSLEATIAEALKQSRADGLYESVVPYVLAVNADLLCPELLVGLAYQNEQVNVLGYFVEAANRFKPSQKFERILKLLAPGKRESKEPLILSTKMNFPELFERNELALKWNLWTRGDLMDHMNRWEKWDKSRKTS